MGSGGELRANPSKGATAKTYSLPKASVARLRDLLGAVNQAAAAYQQEMGACFAWLGIDGDVDARRVAFDFDKGTLTLKPPIQDGPALAASEAAAA